MARSSVELIVDASKAINPLKRVTSETKKLEAATRDVNGRLRDAKGKFVATGAAAKTATRGVNGLGVALKKLLAALAIFEAGKFVVFKTAELQKQQRSLQVLTGSLDSAKEIIGELQAFGAVTPFTSSELVETAKRLKAFGFETEQVVNVTKQLADVAGATGADLGGIATAFGQIQAKGRLQGEELLQLQERGVNLQEQLRKQYNLTADEFQKALEQGRFGANSVSFALEELTSKGGKYADGAIAQSDTLAGKFSTLLDNVERLATRIGTVLQPILNFVLDTSIAIVDAINKALAGPDYATATARLKTVAEEIQKTQTNLKNIESQGITLATPGLPIRGVDGEVLPGTTISPLAKEQGILARLEGERKFLEGRIKELEKSFLKVDKPTPEDKKPPELRDPRGTGGGSNPVAMSQKMLNLLKERIKLSKDENKVGVAIKQNEMQLLEIEESNMSITDKTAAKLKAEEALYNRLRDIHAENAQAFEKTSNEARKIAEEQEKALRPLEEQKELLEAKLIGNEREVRLRQQVDQIMDSTTGLDRTQVEEIVNKTAALQDQVKATEAAAQELDSLYSSIGQSIETGIVDALASAVDGTKALADVAADTLRNVAKILLQFGVSTALGGIPGLSSFFGGGRAKGGTVTGGRSYMVGEKGPELFTPGRTGSIAPSGSFGGANVVVNVDASGTQAQGDQPNAKALGSAIGVAVQAELIKQKRPGGLLA